MGRYFYGFAIDKYQSGPLGSCVRDLHAIRLILEKGFGFVSEEYKDHDVTVKAVRATLDRIARKRAGDDVVIFFSGHGSEAHAWCLFDDHLESRELKETFGRMETRQLLVLSDSCFSLGQATKGAGVTHARTLHDELERNRGKCFLSATGDYVAYDGGDGLSPFAEAFVDVLYKLREPASLSEVYPRIRSRVHGSESTVGRKQVPFLRYLDPMLHGEMVFRPMLGGPTTPRVEPDPSPPTVGGSLARHLQAALGEKWRVALNSRGLMVFLGARNAHVARAKIHEDHLRVAVRMPGGGWNEDTVVRDGAGIRAFREVVAEAWDQLPDDAAEVEGDLGPDDDAEEVVTARALWRKEVEDRNYAKLLRALKVEHLRDLWLVVGWDWSGEARSDLEAGLHQYRGDLQRLFDGLDEIGTVRAAEAFGIAHAEMESWREVESELHYMLREDTTPGWTEAREDRRAKVLKLLQKPEMKVLFRALGSESGWDADQAVADLRSEFSSEYAGTVGGVVRRLPYETLERLVDDLDLSVPSWSRRALEARLGKWLAP